MKPRLECIPEWEWRAYCDATGLVSVSWRQLCDHLVSVERMSAVARAAWLADQEIELARMGLDASSRRRIERAFARGAQTAVGKILAEHDAGNSASLAFWLSKSIAAAE